MLYPETKIYHDGSHFIAIPHTERKGNKPAKKKEEKAVIYNDFDEKEQQDDVFADLIYLDENEVNDITLQDKDTLVQEDDANGEHTGLTLKEIFEELFEQTLGMKKAKRRAYILSEMRKYFKTYNQARVFVDNSIERKRVNLSNRLNRLYRKANLNDFNYFATFTRNDKLCDEKTFKKKLKKCLQNLSTRKGWKYIGVWELSPNGRLHFHALLYVPKGQMVGELVEVRDFDTVSKKMQTTIQNTFFNERFGRSDFEDIPGNRYAKNLAIKYLTKYITKSGEKIVYSRGLPTFVISDIIESDVVAKIDGEFGIKLVLHDLFNCWIEGCFVGIMSKNTISKLRTANG